MSSVNTIDVSNDVEGSWLPGPTRPVVVVTLGPDPGGKDVQGFVEVNALTELFFRDANNNVEYICKAKPGSNTADAVWQIRKFAWTLVGTEYQVDSIKFANGTAEFNQIADDRAVIAVYS